jgi:hypothetical protein
LYIIRNHNHNPTEERHLAARPRKKQSAQRRGNRGARQTTGATRGVISDGRRRDTHNGTCHGHWAVPLHQHRIIRASILHPTEDQRDTRV